MRDSVNPCREIKTQLFDEIGLIESNRPSNSGTH